MRITHSLSVLALALALGACGGSASSGSFFGGNDSSEEVDNGNGGSGSGSGGNTGGNGSGGGSNGGGSGGDGASADANARQVNFRRPGVTLAMLEANTASCASAVRLDGGRNYPVTLPSASGQTISFQVIEPKTINCVKGNPLVLHSHGFGGARTENPAGSFLERLQDNGYAVISIDQRGFNDSTGTVRVMDPDFEGRDLLQILDWAEQHLDYLAYDRPASSSPYNLAAGATGGSYGGMYQLLIHNIDSKNRLDVLTPDITPHDLRSSLYPGGVVKTGWVALLVAGGEAGANQPVLGGLDPVIKETLLRGVVNNEIPTPALNFFYYHSVRYFAADDGTDVSNQDFLTSLLTMSPIMPTFVGAAKPAAKKVDILFSQGFRDTLFNFNEGWANYAAYKALGGDVRLMTHQSGHILPGTQTVISALGPLNTLTDPLLSGLANAGISQPELQRPSGKQSCGALAVDDAALAFINLKLKPPMVQAASTATATALALLQDRICVSINDGSGDSAGEAKYLAADALMANGSAISIPATMIPVPNSALGVTSLLQPTFIPLNGLVGPLTIAGIGQLAVDVTNVIPQVNGCALPLEVPEALTGSIPAPLSGLLGLLPSRLPIRACDAIIYVGFGAKTGRAAPRLLDEQVQPIRGLGMGKTVSMVGVAETLAAGEQLGLMVYGYNLQYLSSLSRDVLVPAVSISGTVQVPIQP